MNAETARGSPSRERYTRELLRQRTLALCAFVEPEVAQLLRRMAEDQVVEEIGTAAHTDCLMPAFLVQVAGYLSSQVPGDPVAAVFDHMHTDDGYRVFHDFCVEHRLALRDLLSTRRIQTHHVERCGPVFPALCLVARMLDAQEVAFFDVGAAGGLHLFWDRYAYTFDGLGTFGDVDSDVRIRWQWRGRVPSRPRDFLRPPRVGARTGIDLDPIDIGDPEGRRWLAAFGATDAALLDSVGELARTHPHRMLRGDSLKLLPSELASVPPHMTPLVMHSFTTIQFSDAMKCALEAILIEAGQQRPVGRVWLEGELDSAEPAQVRVATYTPKGVTQQTVARGETPINIEDWFEWVGPIE